MDPTVPWKQRARWRATRLTNAGSESLTPYCPADAHPTLNRRESGAIIGASKIYETLLLTGKTKKTCTACNRHLNAQEMVVFENYVSA